MTRWGEGRPRTAVGLAKEIATHGLHLHMTATDSRGAMWFSVDPVPHSRSRARYCGTEKCMTMKMKSVVSKEEEDGSEG